MPEKKEKKLMRDSLEGLASVLREEKEEFLAPAGEEALWSSCYLVGNAMGISFPRPKGKTTLHEICEHANIRYRPVSLQGPWWTNNHGHLLAFLKDSADPVALIYSRKQHYLMIDPMTGQKKRVDSKIASLLKPITFMFYNSLPEQIDSIWQFIRFGLQGVRSEYGTLFFSGMFAVILGFLMPLANKIFFDTIIPNFSITLYTQLIAALFIGAFSSAVFKFTRSMVFLRLQGIFKNRVQMSLWDRLLKLPIPFFHRFKSGDLLQRTLLLEQIQETLNHSAMTMLLNSFFSLLYLVMMLYYSWQLTMIALGVSAVGALLSLWAFFLQLPNERERLETNARINSFLTQIINGISKLRIAVAEHWIFARWTEDYQILQKLSLKIRNINNWITTLGTALQITGTILIFYWVMRNIETAKNPSDLLSVGSFLAFYAAYSPFIQALFSLISTLTGIFLITPYWERVKVILEEPIENTSDKIDPGPLTGKIRMENISFRYHPAAPWILRNFNFEANPGEFIGIVGPSGSGKSTLFRLLVGFETAQEGAIYYDENEIKSLNLDFLRGRIGTLLQNSAIFSGTVLDNIIHGTEFSSEEVMKALQLSTFDKDLKELPMGLDTRLPSGGGILSGGQRQRLLLARALVRKPKILLLDEATSFLDNESQAEIIRNLESLEVTRIVVAHRVSTLKNADRIYDLSKIQNA